MDRPGSLHEAIEPISIIKDGNSSFYTSTNFLIRNMKFTPLSIRDAVVTFSRVQEDNMRLRRIFSSLQPKSFKTPSESRPVTTLDVYHHLCSLIGSPLILSFVSALAKQETITDDLYHEVEDRLRLGIAKELSASQLPDKGPVMEYSGLWEADIESPLKPGFFSPNLYRIWSVGLASFMRRSVFNATPKIPHYQKKKNMGYLTQHRFRRYMNDNSLKTSYSTLDLERLYHRTGHRVDGPCEMRYSWKSSQTKPRVYYATGGTGYYAARFIRELCNDMVDILPSTNRFTRYDSNRVTTTMLNDEECLITYDYSSFTTTLSELKYFLSSMADEFKGTPVRVLDTHHGIMELDLGDLIRDYNNSVNRNAEFDIQRIDDLPEIGFLYCQMRSGMLGVQGNIGFSTILHGLHCSMLNDNRESSCVGDDALLRAYFKWLETTLVEIKTLCDGVEDTKFHIWHYKVEELYGNRPDDEVRVISDTSLQGWQYCKRPITIDHSGHIKSGVLPEFPNLASLFGLTLLRNHNHQLKTAGSRFETFANQLSRFLYRVREVFMIEPTDWEAHILHHVFRSCYKAFDVPQTGGLPGEQLVMGQPISSFIPPLMDDLLVTPWYHHLTRLCMGQRFSMGEFATGYAHSGYAHYGDTYKCILHKPQRLARDLGYLTSERIIKDYVVDENLSEFIADVITGVLKPLYLVQYIADPPRWLNDLIYEDTVPTYTNTAGYHEICPFL